MSEPAPPRWDATLYDASHAFVWKHGASLVELLAPRAGERILDLGCGTGHLTAQLAAAGVTVVGLDRSAEMLAKARAEHPSLEFVQGDAREFFFAEPFDAVFSNAMLHWILQAGQVVTRIRDALKPGGRFVAELGGRGNVREIVAALRSAAAALGLPVTEPRWYFPGIAEYAGLLEAAGLEVRFAHLFDRPTPLEGAEGLRNFVRMFANVALDSVPAARHDEFLAAVEAAARPTLFRDGVWSADYRRLRVVAVRTSEGSLRNSG
jgi:trans-aconitate methyltransferase